MWKNSKKIKATKATIKIHYYHNEYKKQSVREQVKARLNANSIENDIDIDIDNIQCQQQ